MALVREPFEFTMVYIDTLTNSKEGRTLVKRLIQTITQTMKEHDEHWNCYNKEQFGLPGERKWKWLIVALEAGRHTLVLFTGAKDFLDEGYFLFIIQIAHNIASKRTEYKSKVIPIVYNMSPAMVEWIKVEKWLHCTGEANIKNNIFYSLDDSTVFINGGSEWCVELANLVAGNPHTTEHNKQ